MIKSDSDPGNRGGTVTGATGGAISGSITKGQEFVVTAAYTEDCFGTATSNPACRGLGAGTGGNTDQTRILRAYIDLHQAVASPRGEWVYLYLDQGTAIGNPSLFTAWAYSPYPNTARGGGSGINARSQKLTADNAITLTASQSVSPVAPTDGRVMLTKSRLAFTVTGVRAYVANRQMNVEWRIRLEDFPGGQINIFQSVETQGKYDAWDQLGMVNTVQPTPVPQPTSTPTSTPAAGTATATAGPPAVTGTPTTAAQPSGTPTSGPPSGGTSTPVGPAPSGTPTSGPPSGTPTTVP